MTMGIERAWSGQVVNARPTDDIFAALLLLGAATAAGTVALASRREPPVVQRPTRLPKAVAAKRDGGGTVLAAQRLNRAAGTIAVSVLIDSAMEHYRGAFRNKAMYTPLATSVLTLLVSLHGHKDSAPRAHWAQDTVYALAD